MAALPSCLMSFPRRFAAEAEEEQAKLREKLDKARTLLPQVREAAPAHLPSTQVPVLPGIGTQKGLPNDWVV